MIRFESIDPKRLPLVMIAFTRADGSQGQVPGYLVSKFDNRLPIVVDTECSPPRGIFYVVGRENTGAALVALSPDLIEMIDLIKTWAKSGLQLEILYREPGAPSSPGEESGAG